MTLKPMLIYNPTAGKGSAGKILPNVMAQLEARGFDCDLVLTDSPGSAQSLGLQAAEEGRTLIVVAGGDGTISEAINGLMQVPLNGRPRPALGVLPVGRGNDFAFGMGISKDIGQACDILVQGVQRNIDVGRVTGGDYPEGRYFGNGVGLGFDTVVGFEAAKIKWLHGAASYLVAVVRTIFLYAHAPIYELIADGVAYRQPFLMVSIMNGRRMGGSFLMAPGSHPGDGAFDLCLAGDVKQIRILPLAASFISGKQEGDPAITMLRASKISVRAVEGSIPAHADGETVCTAGTALDFEIFPGAIQVVCNTNGTHL